ncbi:hypothetical protein D9M73_151750 [compost metagenome]
MGQAFDDQVQEQPVFFGCQFGIGRWIEQGSQFALETLEQPENQRLLAVEVVVEVARADAHLIGNFHGGDIRFALLIEQLQGTFEDPVAGFHPVFLMIGSCHGRQWPWLVERQRTRT